MNVKQCEQANGYLCVRAWMPAIYSDDSFSFRLLRFKVTHIAMNEIAIE